ncbi:hypothetical protein [Umezawaea sp. Da 62-37]|uniref:hypothetical protein n=1 Tax=Umezawaea sp. Da 62-37 TaxID=3075927 RepID=UPI0028F71798|nr:hypothetical protein [Umezawaea sp. Da 62-37]WNV85186.1 hypothetical protein RM788_44830 [Umezawaea sp. Da 62-37]
MPGKVFLAPAENVTVGREVRHQRHVAASPRGSALNVLLGGEQDGVLFGGRGPGPL